MTIITTVISQAGTAHASDSFITRLGPDRSLMAIETQKSKLVRVEHFRGAMSYWGLAEILDARQRWNTLEWLNERANRPGGSSSPEAFARAIASELTGHLRPNPGQSASDFGLGIHFTAYEVIHGYSVPELFLISNWADTLYRATSPQGFSVSRRSLATISPDSGPEADHGDPALRMRVHHWLQNGNSLLFNNGDPALFSHAAEAIFRLHRELQQRGYACQLDTAQLRALARLPIETVRSFLRTFSTPGTQRIGGKLHDLSVTPLGKFESDSGD